MLCRLASMRLAASGLPSTFFRNALRVSLGCVDLAEASPKVPEPNIFAQEDLEGYNVVRRVKSIIAGGLGRRVPGGYD